MLTVAVSRTVLKGKFVGWRTRSTEMVPDVSAGDWTPISMVLDSLGIKKTSSKALNKATVQPLVVIRSGICLWRGFSIDDDVTQCHG